MVGVKITPDTFEPTVAREDFNEVCLEVSVENISPFTNGLFAGLKRLSGMIENSQK